MTFDSLTGVAAPRTETELDEYLSRPSARTIDLLAATDGDLLVVGAGGKMGLNLCMMARRAFDAAGQRSRRVVAASRFASAGSTQQFTEWGIEAMSTDLLGPTVIDQLPEAPLVLYLAGKKFGSADNYPATWATNAFLPGLIAQRFRNSRIVALSTGAVYPLTPVSQGGSVETDPLAPIGEYAQSCLGRERILTYYSASMSTPVALVRLYYANALRYGVITDIACMVAERKPVDLSMGYVNVIWQGDANAAILGAFSLCASPPTILNVAGPETAPVRDTAQRLAELLGSGPPMFVGNEAESALLGNAKMSFAHFGLPAVPLDQLLEWCASWVSSGGQLLNKPTGFQVRDGRF